MFDFLKNIFPGKPDDRNAGGMSSRAPAKAPPSTAPAAGLPAGSGPVPKNYSNGNAFSLPTPGPSASGSAGSGISNALSNGSNGNGSAVQLPLHTILKGLPAELQEQVRHSDVGSTTVSVSLDKVLSQLSHGSVKISFGELRQAAPGVFSSEGAQDHLLVPLPLNEILLRINPALLVRRQNQKQVQVPEEIHSPFGSRGDGLIFSVGPAKTETPAPTPAATPAPLRSVTPAAPIQTPPVQKPVSPASAQLRPASPMPATPPPLSRMTSVPPVSAPSAFRPPTPAPAPQAPLPQTEPIKPVPFRNPFASPSTPPAPMARPAGPPPTSPAPPAFRGVGTTPAAPRDFIPSRLSASPVPQPVNPAGEAPSLSVSLIALMDGWPEVVRQEIRQQNLMDSKIALPIEMLEQALKRGKVMFAWKSLRSWIKPAPLPSVSAHDSAMLELPLKVIAPLFLNRNKDAAPLQHRKVAVDDNIPNLFFGFPQPSPSPAAEPVAETGHAVSKPVDTNYYVWDDTSDSAKQDETQFKRKSDVSPGTNFVTRCSTPNEVVSRAAALEGVAGALIALPDGLMVASSLAADLNGDTLAAFLPHIFGKVSQCTRELRMGELNNLNFTVGNVPWKIFRVNAIFFAAFGRPGQSLPTGQLASLASELDRKKQ